MRLSMPPRLPLRAIVALLGVGIFLPISALAPQPRQEKEALDFS